MTNITEEKDVYHTDSKLVSTLIYDFKRQILSVNFISGPRKGIPREYYGITSEEYLQIKNAKSTGKAVMSLLRKKQGYKKESLFKRIKNHLFSWRK